MQQSFRARVMNGRLVMNEPTDLPEGEEVELVPADTAESEGELTEDERKELDASIAASFEQAAKGQLLDADEVLTKLRAHR